MKLHYKGHAIHVILAHFPSALFPAGLIFELAYLIFSADGLMLTAFYCESLGIIVGAGVILAGTIDLYGLYQRNERRLIKSVLIHGALNTTATIVFLLINAERLETFPSIPPPSWGGTGGGRSRGGDIGYSQLFRSECSSCIDQTQDLTPQELFLFEIKK